MLNKTIFSILILVAPFAFASKNLELTVSFGDKKTHFRIWEDKNQTYYSYFRGPGRLVQEPLSSRNFEYIFSKAHKISKLKSNDLGLCHRRTMSLVITDATTKNVRGCIGSKTPVAKKLTQFANLLDKLI